MYKTSFALASVFALAEALYLQECGNTCCNDGGDDEVNEETQEVIDDFIEDIDNEFELVEEEGTDGMGEPCAVGAHDLFNEFGWTMDQEVTADLAVEKINYMYMNDLWSRQQSNHWFNWLGAADDFDGLSDDVVTMDDMVAVCQDTYGAEFFFEASPDDDFLRDHPIEDLTEEVMILLDKDQNGDVNIDSAATNLENYVADDTLTEEEADDLFAIVSGALAQEGADYKGDGSVMNYDITKYLSDNFYYYDWQGEGSWKIDSI